MNEKKTPFLSTHENSLIILIEKERKKEAKQRN